MQPTVAVLPVPDCRQREPGPPRMLGTGLESASFAETTAARYLTVTVTGGEAIPLATTTSVLLPAGVPAGSVNWVEDLAPAAMDTEDQLVVRA